METTSRAAGVCPLAVRRCVLQAKRAIHALGFRTNDKCRDCEDRSVDRRFLGCSTSRNRADYPRKKYRALRKELRAFLESAKSPDNDTGVISEAGLLSMKCRIDYISRLNYTKGRRLLD